MLYRIPKQLEHLQMLGPPNPYIEIITMLIIVGVSFYIYFKTKEIYDLTKHRGIDYFRKAFLFFGLSALFGSLIHSLRGFIDFGHYFRSGFFIMATLMLIAVLYAFFSLFWKEFKEEKYIYIIALSVLLISFLIDVRPVVLIFQSLLFITIGVVSYVKYKKKIKQKKKSFSNMYLMYMGLFLFWLLSAIRFQLAVFFDITGDIISIVSALIFVYILYVFEKRFSHK